MRQSETSTPRIIEAPHLNYDAIRSRTEDFRRENSSLFRDVPIQIEEAIQRLGIKVRFRENLKLSHGLDGCLAPNGSYIYIDRMLMANPKYFFRLRFTLAEELGHMVLHHELIDFDDADINEKVFKNQSITLSVLFSSNLCFLCILYFCTISIIFTIRNVIINIEKYIINVL